MVKLRCGQDVVKVLGQSVKRKMDFTEIITDGPVQTGMRFG